MADANQAAEELARVLQQINTDLANYSRISQTTMDQRTDAEMKAKHGIENFTAGTKKGADAVGSLAAAGMAAGKAMLEGKKGAAAFNSSLDQLSTAATAAGAALSLLVPVIGPLVAIVVAAGTAFIKYTQAANEMADKLYTGYRGLAKSGAAAADGMTGLSEGAQKLGLSMDELGEYVQIVSENSRDLANFGGSVYKGRQALENMGKAMEPARESMLKMGLMPKDVAEGMAGYLRTQTRLGNAQKMSVDQLAEGARKYLVEQDALTKLTGVARQEREKMREEAMMEEQHAGLIRKLQLQGDNGKLEAERVQKISDMANSFSPAIAKMVRSLQTGVITEEGQKLLMSAPDAIKNLQLAQKGQISEAEAVERIFKQVGRTADSFGKDLAVLGANNDTYVAMDEANKVRIIGENGVVKSLKEVEEEQKKQGAKGGKAADELVDKQAKLIDTQIRANQSLTDFIRDGIGPAQDKMILLAEATAWAAAGLSEMFGKKNKEAEKKKSEEVLTTQMSGVGRDYKLSAPEKDAAKEQLETKEIAGVELSERDRKWLEQRSAETGKRPGVDGARAAGGPVDAGKLYKVGERGEEYFRPGIAGEIVPNDKISGIAGAANSRIEIVQRAAKEIADDTATLAKITDVDLKKTQDFSRLQDRLRKLKTELGLDEVELLEEQKDELTKMLNDMEKTMGKGSADAARRNIVMQRAMGGMGGMGGIGGGMGGGMGGGIGGGQGLKGPESHQAVGGGQGLKGPPKLVSVRSKTGKSAEVNAEYAPRFQSLIDYLDSIGYEINSLGGYVDRDVRGRPGVKSVHAHGAAIDINPGANPMGGQLITDLPENISSIAQGLGLGWGGNWASIKDAMHFSVAANEGGDIKLSDGGIAVGPNSGYPATLHGQEAVIPLSNGGGNFVKLFESMADSNSKMVSMLDELVRAQKTNNDISNKILRTHA